jgi:hypothetical protein
MYSVIIYKALYRINLRQHSGPEQNCLPDASVSLKQYMNIVCNKVKICAKF